jgi:cell division septation protein DedD
VAGGNMRIWSAFFISAALAAAGSVHFSATAADLYDAAKSQAAVIQNSQELQSLIAKAADGDIDVQFRLGLMYHLGKTVPQNYIRATQWYKLAASGGSTNARNNLGVIHRDGLSVPANDVLAYMWLNLAASDQGPYGLARKNRDALGSKMSSDRILQAQQLGEEYLKTLSKKRRQLEEARAKIAASNMREELSKKVMTGRNKSTPPILNTSPAVQLAKRQEETNKSDLEEWLGTQLNSLVSTFNPGRDSSPKYLVQLGLFQNSANVKMIQQKLAQADVELKVENVVLEGREYKRLRVGPYDDDDGAREMAQRVDNMFQIKSLLIPKDY